MRSILRFGLYLQTLVPLSISASFAGPRTEASRCRCLSTETCWPSTQEFSALESQLSQPLLRPVPPASPCYTALTSSDCLTVQNSWDNGTWHATQPGSMQSSNWNDFIFRNGTIDACYLNTTLGVPCEQGSVPVTGVDARWPEDVQAAVQFAAAHDLRVVVKNTGHDYLGRSTARGSFLIWTHHMKNISFHETFQPAGGPSSVSYDDAITLGAGIQWSEAYAAVTEHDRVIVGGVSAGGSVGAAGGWVQGGGHSILAPKYGLGVDNVLQITVVTADGVHRTANAYQNADLFWALRGGGGGTWGIITSVTYKTHPSAPLIVSLFITSINTSVPNTNATSPVLKELFTEFIRVTPAMADGGWAGYSTTSPMGPTSTKSLGFLYAAPNVSWAAANATMNPFLDFARALAARSSVETTGELTISAAGTFPVASFATLYDTFLANTTGQVGGNVEITSRLLPRTTIEQDHESVADTLLSFPSALHHLVAGGAVASANPSSVGLNPAWRKALLHTVVGAVWDEGASVATITQQRDTLKEYTSALNSLVPHAGAYLNEASLYEADPHFTFFGSHYARLKSIKTKYDPKGLFVVASGVGSEDWDTDLNCHV